MTRHEPRFYPGQQILYQLLLNGSLMLTFLKQKSDCAFDRDALNCICYLGLQIVHFIIIKSIFCSH